MSNEQKFPDSIWLIDTGCVQDPIVWCNDSNPAGANPAPESAKYVREALAQQPAAGVELTDAEIIEIWRSTRGWRTAEDFAVPFARAVIAAHEAKKNGGGV